MWNEIVHRLFFAFDRLRFSRKSMVWHYPIMKKAMFSLTAFAVCAHASQVSAQEPEAAPSQPTNEIVVTAEMERDAEEKVEEMSRAITRRPRTDKPIAKKYESICVGVFGFDPAYASALIAQVEENARRLDIPVAGEGCKVNTLIAFVKDAKSEVKTLRSAAPWLFSEMLDFEYKRALRGNGGAHAWQTTEVREADGQPITEFMFGNPPRAVQITTPFQTTRLGQQIRMDVVGSVVIFDTDRLPGKTLRQLADYASMRSFAPVDDLSNSAPNATPSILSLFDEETTPPAEMTGFDWAYLEALYSLPATARGSAIHDAAWSRYRTDVFKLED